jgi:segregation and condensation protein B
MDRLGSTAIEHGGNVPFDPPGERDVQAAVLDEPITPASPVPDGPVESPSAHTPRPVEPVEEPVAEITPAQVIEALLFASDAPLSAARLAELVGAGTPRDVQRHVDELNSKYAEVGLAFRIELIARGYRMMTLAQYRPWLSKLERHHGRTRLSDAALEALAVVAYRQPIIRADVEAIRGVGCGEVLNRLREMGLIKVIGRAEVVGRPMLYGTTRKFLDTFGLADLDDLPPMEALTLRPTTAEREPAEPDEAEGASPDARAAAGA